MAEWRFGVSIVLGMLGDAGVGLGIYSFTIMYPSTDLQRSYETWHIRNS